MHVHLLEHLQVDDAYDFASRLLLQNFEEVLTYTHTYTHTHTHATPTAQYKRIPAALQTRAVTHTHTPDTHTHIQ